MSAILTQHMDPLMSICHQPRVLAAYAQGIAAFKAAMGDDGGIGGYLRFKAANKRC